MSQHLEQAGQGKPAFPPSIVLRVFALRNDIERFITNACRKRATPSDTAEDLTQETLMRGVESLGSFNRTENDLRQWLLGIASHVVMNDERTSCRHDEHFSRAPLDLETTTSALAPPDRVCDATRNLERVRNVLATMPEHWRNVLELVGMDGLTYAEAGKKLGLSEEATKKLTYRVREHLLKKSGVRRDDLRAVFPFVFREEKRRYFPFGPRTACVVAACALVLLCVRMHHKTEHEKPPTLALNLPDFSAQGFLIEPLPTSAAPSLPMPIAVDQTHATKRAEPRAPRVVAVPSAGNAAMKRLDVSLAGLDYMPIEERH